MRVFGALHQDLLPVEPRSVFRQRGNEPDLALVRRYVLLVAEAVVVVDIAGPARMVSGRDAAAVELLDALPRVEREDVDDVPGGESLGEERVRVDGDIDLNELAARAADRLPVARAELHRDVFPTPTRYRPDLDDLAVVPADMLLGWGEALEA
ncbi:hypothetical protein THAOC_37592 [Thalassiosira oceanica]|uniref:Uncharacterized protein n=1 Tax=Thalassiosira oceanica TaxID=159749 RepID=K0RBL7_THAOC|nr:hypothetical protein THAOC_37592 [Thalassiosira oceanica]|eukprot:EJK43917.1 hypothetical protein THAOC_37592 [Thalassiosira oceanica]